MIRLLVLASLAATSAFAEDEKIPLVENKLHPMQYRLELTAFFDRTLHDKYIEHTGASGAATFHFRDYFALEAFGGYLIGDETGIVGKVRLDGDAAARARDFEACANNSCEPALPDMWQTTWFLGGDAQWTPIYGKFSILSESDISFQAYGILGGGAEGITRLTNDLSYDAEQVRFSANYGLGLRLMPWKHVAIRAEIRNYNGFNPNVEEHDPEVEARCPNGYTLNVGGEEQCHVDISENTMRQVGVSFVF
jgi:outer membrane beta-barrel protein